MSYLVKSGVLAATVLAAGAASAATLQITVTNEQATGGLYLTPFLSIFHDGSFDSFDAGAPASTGVEAIAEEGDIAPLRGIADAAGHVTAVSANPAGFPGAPVLDPGEVATIEIELDSTDNRYFSFLSMVIPSNDTFIGNDNPLAYELFDSTGQFIFDRLIQVTASDAWDGGTELDDGNGAAFAPGTGFAATETTDPIARLANLDFLLGRPQAVGGTVQSANGLLASISITEVAPVPLPAGLPLLLAGLGALGIAGRRRKA